MTNSTSETRAIEVEREVAGSPADAWDLISTTEGLKKWFPLDARVDPGADGKVWLSWGPDMSGEAGIHVWEEERRMGWTESYGEDESGRPIKIAVDFHIESRDGNTVVRVVQSGFSAGAEWDEMFDAIKDGWTYFMFNLAHCLSEHVGRDRTMVWKRAPTALSREKLWERMTSAGWVAEQSSGSTALAIGGEQTGAEVVLAREGRVFAARVPEMAESIWFVEIEGKHVGFWLSTYDVDGARVDALQSWLDAEVEGIVGPPPEEA